MGGGGYIRPVKPTGISSYASHKRRTVPSKEPGTDYYCPIGTPVHIAGDGVVVAVGNSIAPATGRWYAVNLDDGRSYRDMHMKRVDVRVGQRVSRGQIAGPSGATGYGEEDWSWNPATGGAHVHRTLFPGRWGAQAIGNTLDPEAYSTETPNTARPSGGDAQPFVPPEEDDMPYSPEELKQIMKAAAKDALYETFLNGKGPDGKYWPLFDLVAEQFLDRPVQVQDEGGNPVFAEGRPVTYRLRDVIANGTSAANAAKNQ